MCIGGDIRGLMCIGGDIRGLMCIGGDIRGLMCTGEAAERFNNLHNSRRSAFRITELAIPASLAIFSNTGLLYLFGPCFGPHRRFVD